MSAPPGTTTDSYVDVSVTHRHQVGRADSSPDEPSQETANVPTDAVVGEDVAQTSRTANSPRVGDFGDRLRALREARGLSGPHLARLANYSRGYIWELTMGRKPPRSDVASRLDRLLQADGELVALAAGGNPVGSIGFVCVDDTWLRVRAGSSLVTLSLETLVGDVAALTRVRDMVLAGQARAEIDLTRAQVTEVIQLLSKAVTVAPKDQDA